MHAKSYDDMHRRQASRREEKPFHPHNFNEMLHNPDHAHVEDNDGL